MVPGQAERGMLLLKVTLQLHVCFKSLLRLFSFSVSFPSYPWHVIPIFPVLTHTSGLSLELLAAAWQLGKRFNAALPEICRHCVFSTSVTHLRTGMHAHIQYIEYVYSIVLVNILSNTPQNKTGSSIAPIFTQFLLQTRSCFLCNLLWILLELKWFNPWSVLIFSPLANIGRHVSPRTSCISCHVLTVTLSEVYTTIQHDVFDESVESVIKTFSWIVIDSWIFM